MDARTLRGATKGNPLPTDDETMRRYVVRRVRLVDNGHDTPCWEWQGSRNRKGYATANLRRLGGVQSVHRLAYRLWKGLVGLPMLDHLCEIKHCVNPDHLDPVTNGENIRRWYERRRLGAIGA